MGMGKRTHRQEPLWVATQELPRSSGHVFYERVNGLLKEKGFDRFVEQACQEFYAPVMGRPSLAPGVYFRMLLVGALLHGSSRRMPYHRVFQHRG